MEDIKFDTVYDLYNRLKPALNTKKDEIVRNGYNFIMIEDIWNYLRKEKWNKSKNLNLYEMVDDIMNVEAQEIEKHIKETLQKSTRSIEEEDHNLL